MNVERKIASTDAITASTTKLGSKGRTPSQPRLTPRRLLAVWETGFVETIRAHAVDIIKSAFFSKLQNVVIANVMKHLGGAGKGAPADVSPDSVEPLIVDPDASRAATAVARGGAAAMTEADLIDREDEITATVEEDLMADDSIANSMQTPEKANDWSAT